MTRAAVAAMLAVAASLPRTADACATCISSGFGDRAYTWPYIGLILMPFLVAVAIVATLAWYAGWRPSVIAARVSLWAARRWQRPERSELSPRTNTETT
jgi:hypothetical protein